MKVCPCGEKETPDNLFYAKSALCRKCYSSRRVIRAKARRAEPAARDLLRKWFLDWRHDPNQRHKVILKDSLRADRLEGRGNDLSKEFIQSMISNGCAYCGETELKMTLDRKDNSIGHTRDNVTPCCIRCNYIRRDMPYEAWLVVAQSIREARELGLFGTWTCAIHKRNLESKAG